MDFSILNLAGLLVAVIAVLLTIRLGGSLLMVFFALLPFPLAIGGEGGSGNISPADIAAGVALLTLLSRSHYRLGGVGRAVIVFIVVATVSSLISSTLSESLLGLGRMALVTLAPVLLLANAEEPLRELKRGLTVYCLSTAVLACFSIYYFATGGIEASMYTLGINKNGLGPIFGSAVVITFTSLMTTAGTRRRRIGEYVVLGFSSVGLLLTLCRGGWVGTTVALVLVMALTRRVKIAAYSAVILLPVIAGIWATLPEDRVEYASDMSASSYTMQTRFNSMDQAMDAFKSSPLLGVGIGLRRRVEPHNVLVLTLGETGVVGLAGFVMMVGAGVVTLVSAFRRLGPGHPGRAVVLAGLAVFTVYHVQTMVDVYWRRGVGALSWACVGMAVAVVQLIGPPKTRSVAVRPRAMRPSAAPL